MAGAILEALNYEAYLSVVPAYYEETLKNRNARDPYSSQIIEIIYNSAYTDFVFAYDSSLLGIGTIMRNLVQENSINYVSTVKKKQAKVQKIIETMVASYDK